MEDPKREDVEDVEDAAAARPVTAAAEEPFPELDEMLREAIHRELSEGGTEGGPDESDGEGARVSSAVAEPAEPVNEVAVADPVEDARTAEPAEATEPADSAEAEEADDLDPELQEIRDILLGATGGDGRSGSQLPGLVRSVRRELREAFEGQTDALREHSRDTRAVLEELLAQVKAIARTLKALETDPE